MNNKKIKSIGLEIVCLFKKVRKNLTLTYIVRSEVIFSGKTISLTYSQCGHMVQISWKKLEKNGVKKMLTKSSFEHNSYKSEAKGMKTWVNILYKTF